MIRWHLKLTITELHLIFTLVLATHLGLMALSSGSRFIVDNDMAEKERLATKKKKRELQSDEKEQLASEHFVRKPFVITYLGNVKEKRYSELLSLLVSKNLPLKTVVGGEIAQVGHAKDIVSELEYSEEKEFRISNEQKRNLIKRLIRKNLNGVEICKRSHLLEDEFLLGTIKVNMKIKSARNVAIPKFEGHGNRKIIESLESCVRGKLASLTFPQELTDEEVTFDFKVN